MQPEKPSNIKHSLVSTIFLIVSALPLFLLAGVMFAGGSLFQGEIAGWNFLWGVAAIFNLSAVICVTGIALAIVSRAKKYPFGAFVVGALLGGSIAILGIFTSMYYRFAIAPRSGEIHCADGLGLQWPVDVREATVLGNGQSVRLLLVDKAGTQRRYILDDEPGSFSRYELVTPFESGQFAGLQSHGHGGSADETCLLPLLEIWMGRTCGKRVQRSMLQGDFRSANRLVSTMSRKDDTTPDPHLVVSVAQRMKENIPSIGAGRSKGTLVCWRFPAGAEVTFPQSACLLQPGDTLASLSRNYYGICSRMTIEAILNANPHLEENTLENGTKIVIPALHIEGMPTTGMPKANKVPEDTALTPTGNN